MQCGFLVFILKDWFFFKTVDCTCYIKREAEEFYIFTMGIKPPTNTTKKL
jgi:hypothetical protein